MTLKVKGEFCAIFMKFSIAGLSSNDNKFGLGAYFSQRDTEAEVDDLDN